MFVYSHLIHFGFNSIVTFNDPNHEKYSKLHPQVQKQLFKKLASCKGTIYVHTCFSRDTAPFLCMFYNEDILFSSHRKQFLLFLSLHKKAILQFPLVLFRVNMQDELINFKKLKYIIKGDDAASVGAEMGNNEEVSE